MSGTALLADHLQYRMDELLDLWRRVVERRDDIPDAEELSLVEFHDHIPELLERLAESLRGHGADGGTRAGEKHGEMRWRQGYDVSQMVLELGALRHALLRASFRLAREGKLDLDNLETASAVINEVISEATASSVRTFQEAQADRLRAVNERDRGRQAALGTILRNLPAGVWVADASGVIVTTNREAERLQGFAISGDDTTDNVFGTFGDRIRQQRPDGRAYGAADLPLMRALRGEVVEREEIHWRLDDGVQITTANAAPLLDHSGVITGAVVVVVDITPLKRAESELRRRIELDRAITDSMDECLYALDQEGRFTFANPAAERLLGWERDELIGRDAHETVHALKADGSPNPVEECPIQSTLRSGQPSSGDETFRNRAGEPIHVAYNASPILADGEVAGAVVLFHDNAVQKWLEAELAAAEAQFRSIAEQSPVMIWRADVAGRCDWFNQTWCDFRGRSHDDEVAADRAEAVHPEDRARIRETFAAALAQREPFEITYRLLRGDGLYRSVVDRGTPYRDARGMFLGYLGSCVDITERVELESLLAREKGLAEEASRHKTQLLSSLSHDARTPLNAVVLSAQLLETYAVESRDPEVEHCLRTIRHSVRNVLDLLGDLLNLSKIDAGALPADATQFPLGLVLAESLSSIEAQAQVKGLAVRSDSGRLAGLVLETDRAKLKQILCNLLSNALRYTESGHIRLGVERTTDALRISVEDTGIGIAQEDQHRIFDEFATLNQPQQHASEGTGLGLAICRRLANLLGGVIHLASRPGVGSTFTLVLPESVVVAETTPERALPNVADRGSASTEQLILIVEDHTTSRQTLAKVLKRRGYRVAEAGDGREALAVLREVRPDVVLMDVNMPLMDGIEATRILRDNPTLRGLPVFALTGDVTLQNRQRMEEVGVDGFLEKPVTLEAVEAALAGLKLS